MPNDPGDVLNRFISNHVEMTLELILTAIQAQTGTLPTTGGGKPNNQEVLQVLDLMEGATEKFFHRKRLELEKRR